MSMSAHRMSLRESGLLKNLFQGSDRSISSQQSAPPDYAPIASGENADRKREIAFTRDPFMFFGDTLDAVARVARISVRGRNKMTNFIWTRG